MAKREVLGHMACPECDYERAEIKLQKCGAKLYRYCPECNAQAFARTPAQEKAMRRHLDAKPAEPAKVEAVEAVEEAQKPAAPVAVKPAPVKVAKPAAKPVEAAPVPAPKKSGLADALAFLGGR